MFKLENLKVIKSGNLHLAIAKEVALKCIYMNIQYRNRPTSHFYPLRFRNDKRIQ